MNPIKRYPHRVVKRELDLHLRLTRSRGYVYYPTGEIVIVSGLPMWQHIRVLAHEIGHLECGHGDRPELSHPQKEWEAESFAHYWLRANRFELQRYYGKAPVSEAIRYTRARKSAWQDFLALEEQ